MTKYQFTGQYNYEPEIGLQFYNARFYDSTLGRFAQADYHSLRSGTMSIIPASQGVQAWDRFGYVNNSPVNYTDPTGHMIDDGSNTGGGGGSKSPDLKDDGEDDKVNNNIDFPIEDCFTSASNGAYCLDVASLWMAEGEVVLVGIISALITADLCSVGFGGCLVGLGLSFAVDVAISGASTIAGIENFLGYSALILTGIADIQNGSTYRHVNSDGTTNIGIGLDTAVSLENALLGTTPESLFDAYVSNEQVIYDQARMSGSIKTQSIVEFTIPYLWGCSPSSQIRC